MRPRPGPAILAVVVASAAFALALAGRGVVGVWWPTAVAAAVSVALAAWADGRRLVEKLRPRVLPAFGGLVAGLALAGATHVGYRVIAPLAPQLPDLAGALYADLQLPPAAILLLPLLMLITLAEELVWRGLLVDLLAPRFSPFASGLVATGLYALPLVASGNLALVALGLGCGAVWTALRLATDGLVAPWLCHLVWGVFVFSLWPVAASA